MQEKGPLLDYGKSNSIFVDATEKSEGLGRVDPSCRFVMARSRRSKHTKEDIK